MTGGGARSGLAGARNAAVSALLIAVLAVGCGSGATQSRKGRLQADAARICDRVNSALTTQAPAGASRATLARIVAENAVLEQHAVTELDRLTAPAALRTRWTALLGYRRTLASELAEFAPVKARGDEARAQALLAAKAALHLKLLEAADAVGVPQCANAG